MDLCPRISIRRILQTQWQKWVDPSMNSRTIEKLFCVTHSRIWRVLAAMMVITPAPFCSQRNIFFFSPENVKIFCALFQRKIVVTRDRAVMVILFFLKNSEIALEQLRKNPHPYSTAILLCLFRLSLKQNWVNSTYRFRSFHVIVHR